MAPWLFPIYISYMYLYSYIERVGFNLHIISDKKNVLGRKWEKRREQTHVHYSSLSKQWLKHIKIAKDANISCHIHPKLVILEVLYLLGSC